MEGDARAWGPGAVNGHPGLTWIQQGCGLYQGAALAETLIWVWFGG